MNDICAAIPWPDFLIIGIPAFLAGLITGGAWGSRHSRRTNG